MKKRWLIFALATMLLWGVWGAFTGLPTEHGFPDTLIYVVWAITMIPPAIFALRKVGWKLAHNARSAMLGLVIGALGAGGQMALFAAVKQGPAYLVFPIIAMSPVVTILMSYFLLKERTGWLGMAGVGLAICALPLFDYAPGNQASSYGLWFVLTLGVLIAWGVQGYLIKSANATMDAESIFFYATVAALAFIPAALWMTDFSKPINLGLNGPVLAAGIQILNAVGALMMIYAFRDGKALVVSPLINAGAPLLTTVISLAVAATLPNGPKAVGIALAVVAALLLALQPEEPSAAAQHPA